MRRASSKLVGMVPRFCERETYFACDGAPWDRQRPIEHLDKTRPKPIRLCIGNHEGLIRFSHEQRKASTVVGLKLMDFVEVLPRRETRTVNPLQIDGREKRVAVFCVGRKACVQWLLRGARFFFHTPKSPGLIHRCSHMVVCIRHQVFLADIIYAVLPMMLHNR